MNATATHDTKRGEDVRARLNVLSELSAEWKQRQQHWSDLTRRLKSEVGGVLVPDANFETFVYQTLLGAWPLDDADLPQFRERMRAYLIKVGKRRFARILLG